MSYINEQKIEKTKGYMLGDKLLSSVTDYFADETHQKEFEQWRNCVALKRKSSKE